MPKRTAGSADALESRHMTEDVPDGLSFYLALAAVRQNSPLKAIDWPGFPMALVSDARR